MCKSDHFAITFEIKANVKIRHLPKRKILNFKKANWIGLSDALEMVPWDHFLDSREPETAWMNFKTILMHFVDIYIPTITVKSAFTSPWFDS